jgi:hypothetical protein
MVRRPRLAFTALFLLGSTVHATEVKPIRITYVPHDGCPTENEFLEEVRQVAGHLRLAEGEEPARCDCVTGGIPHPTALEVA